MPAPRGVAPAGVEPQGSPLILEIRKNGRLYLGKTEIPLSDLGKKLVAILESRKNKQVYIQADKAVNYGLVAQAMGEVQAAGITNIGLITLPKPGL